MPPEADAAKAEDTNAFAVHAGLQWIKALPRPVAALHPTLAADHAACLCKQHGDAEIGDVLGEHIWRVCDADVAFARRCKVHRVEADAVDRDDLQLRQCLDHGAVGSKLAARGKATDAGAVRGKERRLVRGFEIAVHGEGRIQPFLVPCGIRADLQQLDFAHDMSFDSPRGSPATPRR